jgi:hypothetical protein
VRAYPLKRCDFCGDYLDVHGVARGHCGRQDCATAALRRGIARRDAARRAQVQAVAEAHRDQLLAQLPALAGTGIEVLVVPGLDMPFLPAAQSRRTTLVEHVEEILAAPAPPAATAAVEALTATGDAATIGIAACTACQGYCCRKAGDSAYLTAETMARVRAQFPGLSDAAIAAVYHEAVPDVGASGSCIYHGVRGCTLRRDFRADICNTYFCDPVARVLDSGSANAVLVVVVEELRVKRSLLAQRRPGQRVVASDAGGKEGEAIHAV